MNIIDIKRAIVEYRKLSYAEKRGKSNPFLKLRLDSFLPHLVGELARVKPIKVGDKYSPTKTIEAMQDLEDLKARLHIVYISPRSSLYVGDAAKNARYSSLTPIFLYAMKEHYGIGYEEWDKTDTNFKFLLSEQQEILLEPIPKLDYDIFSLREEHLVWGGKVQKVTGWKGKKIFLSDDLELGASDIRLRILLQTWLANVELRIPEVMILDLWNWDNVPSPVDCEMVDISEDPKVQNNVEIPW